MDLILRKFGLFTAANEGHVVSSANHLGDTDAAIEI